jgi:uncharacterized SAM-binding protein YcdF (DUF218 family)
MTEPLAAPSEDRPPVRRRVALLLAAGVAVSLGLLAFSLGFAGFVHGLDATERDPAASADGIVALTGGSQRIEDAIELLARGYGRRLLITGVNVRTDRDAIARLSPRQRDLVDCCVDLDYRARNTVGNAVETRRWARENGFRSLIVVTSNYHMPRTMAELDHALPDARKASHSVITPTVDPQGWWRSPNAIRVLVSEYAKYVVASLRTRLTSARLHEGEPLRAAPKRVAEPVPPR